ncbi:MAG: DUF2269 domain-containing protein [Chromatiales bacterium]|jgi:uncharacterized membrane protein
MEYLTLKWIHILSAILLFGTGLGSAFYKFFTDRSGDIRAIAVTNRLVVFADWLITTPTIIIQPISGFWMLYLLNYPAIPEWIWLSLALYLLAGACWLPVVVLQIRMRDQARQSIATGQPLSDDYWRMARIWFWLGVPAFIAMVAVVWLMVFKPI